jgi:hypothetical protein
MDSRDLTPDQLIRIRDAVGRHVRTLRGIANALERDGHGTLVATSGAFSAWAN